MTINEIIKTVHRKGVVAMITPPCHRDCPRRSETCHANCEDYILYSKKKEEERQNRKKVKDAHYFDAAIARRRRFV